MHVHTFTAAAVFTTNKFQAGPVIASRQILEVHPSKLYPEITRACRPIRLGCTEWSSTVGAPMRVPVGPLLGSDVCVFTVLSAGERGVTDALETVKVATAAGTGNAAALFSITVRAVVSRRAVATGDVDGCHWAVFGHGKDPVPCCVNVDGTPAEFSRSCCDRSGVQEATAQLSASRACTHARALVETRCTRQCRCAQRKRGKACLRRS